MSKFLDGTGLADLCNNIKTYITNQLASYAPKNSPALTGTPTAPTPTAGDDSTKIATTAYVQNELSAYSTTTDWADIANKPSFATVSTTGSYNDLTNKPTIPVVPTNVSAFTNDAGYVTTDVNVTNTLNTTTKFYITGTTSNTTSTGTQVFDSGVYVGSTAGEIGCTSIVLASGITLY